MFAARFSVVCTADSDIFILTVGKKKNLAAEKTSVFVCIQENIFKLQLCCLATVDFYSYKYKLNESKRAPNFLVIGAPKGVVLCCVLFCFVFFVPSRKKLYRARIRVL